MELAANQFSLFEASSMYSNPNNTKPQLEGSGSLDRIRCVAWDEQLRANQGG